ncbi:hypothetical protein AALP_AA7G086400 [Arabis alpina]|uniref:Dof zinc finger protein n=1 Tax=Arabis alpina TaxID=50452 RepID=A0A087GGS9_ARAAL|nr:hypothetical protein AALP_AA7G086400 [Arabis alpina]
MPSEMGLTRPARLQAAYPPPNLAEPLPCPRCNSTNTKFCYYNNYNLAQPRYYCKSCRRYWTHGGSLRDVPVGGGTRRNSSKRHRSPTATASSSASVVTTTNQSEVTATTETKGSDVISGNGNESFESLFGGQNEGGTFLALGSGTGVGLNYGFGFGYGLEEMSIPVSDTWKVGEMEGKGGDSLIWPGLEISM